MKDDSFYLGHIAAAVKDIDLFLAGVDYDAFSSNRMMINAVVKELEIIGEAANNVSQGYKFSHPEIPWDKMVDMRNFLVHEYFGIKQDVVWSTCKKDLPELKSALAKILEM